MAISKMCVLKVSDPAASRIWDKAPREDADEGSEEVEGLLLEVLQGTEVTGRFNTGEMVHHSTFIDLDSVGSDVLLRYTAVFEGTSELVRILRFDSFAALCFWSTGGIDLGDIQSGIQLLRRLQGYS